MRAIQIHRPLAILVAVCFLADFSALLPISGQDGLATEVSTDTGHNPPQETEVTSTPKNQISVLEQLDISDLINEVYTYINHIFSSLQVSATPTITPVVEVGKTPSVCESNALPPRLSVGSTAQVTLATGNLRIRVNPGFDGIKLRDISPGVIFTVLDGPICEDDINWWKIEEGDFSENGWVAEGVENQYYLELVSVAEVATPSPSPTQYIELQGAFTEDFSGVIDDWRLNDLSTIQNEELIVTSQTDKDYILVPFTTATPFDISLQVRFTPEALASNQTVVAILYGDITSANYVAVKIRPDFMNVVRVVDGREEFLQSLSLPNPQPDWTSYQTIQIRFRDTLGVYINNQLLGISGYEPLGNQIGVGIEYFGDRGNSTIMYDNIQISLVTP